MLIEEHVANPGQRSVCVREVQKSIRMSVKRLLEDKIESMGVQHLFLVQDKEIRSTQGEGVIIFGGLQNHTADSIKSLEGFDRCWIEEAQSLSSRSLNLLRPTIRKPGSQIWASWNPRFESDPIDVLLRGESPPLDAAIVEVNYRDNPWLPDVVVDEMELDRDTDPDKYAHVWLGGYADRSEARVFRNWKVEEFDTDSKAVFRLGADWGFSIDPTTLVRCYEVGRMLYIDHEAYMVGCEITDTPDLFRTVPDSEQWPIVADSARPETISHLRKHGFPKIMRAVKGPKSVEDGVAWLQTHQIVVHPRCTHTIEELSKYAYKIDKQTERVLPILADKHNHVIDALRYACEGLRRGASQPTGAQEAPPKAKHHW